MFDIPAAIEAGSNMITTIANKFAPDQNEVEKNRLTLALTEMNNQYAEVLGQLQVNTEEAKHPSVFVAGWRPAIGWVCASGIGYQVLLMPVVNGICLVFGLPAVFPGTDIQLLQTLVGGMLGLGIARSWDKSNGSATTNLNKGK